MPFTPNYSVEIPDVGGDANMWGEIVNDAFDSFDSIIKTNDNNRITGDNTTLASANSYADSLVVGLWDDRGNYDASGNLFPSSGGSGVYGEVLKGDIWTISVAGTLGGAAVNIGDTVRALVDAPDQVSSNWALGEANLGYTPENSANKNSINGYAGLSSFDIQFKNNVGGSNISLLRNLNSSPRLYTFQDRNGTIADDTDLGLKANLASPALTGTPTAPTAVVDTNTTQIATTAYVIGQAGNATPLQSGIATAGTSQKYSRQDHKHPNPNGLLLSVSVLTSGTTFTTGPNTNTIKLRLVGGGAAGGGGASALVNGAAGAGGGAGAYAEKIFTVTPSTGYTYGIGAGGTPGAAGNNPGGNGGNTTFTVGATTVTAPGGAGGAGMAAVTLGNSQGGAGGAIATNGDLNSGGECGECGIQLSATIGNAGRGGGCQFGAGGQSRITAGAGNAAVGFGSGGGGGLVLNNSGSVAGGAGAAGVIIVEEYT